MRTRWPTKQSGRGIKQAMKKWSRSLKLTGCRGSEGSAVRAVDPIMQEYPQDIIYDDNGRVLAEIFTLQQVWPPQGRKHIADSRKGKGSGKADHGAATQGSRVHQRVPAGKGLSAFKS